MDLQASRTVLYGFASILNGLYVLLAPRLALYRMGLYLRASRMVLYGFESTCMDLQACRMVVGSLATI